MTAGTIASAPPTKLPFTQQQRDFIRGELGRKFAAFGSLADGMHVSVWQGGEKRGQPKPMLALQGLLESGMVELRPGPFKAPRAFFTDAGKAALKQWARARRSPLTPANYPIVLAELGLIIEGSISPDERAA